MRLLLILILCLATACGSTSGSTQSDKSVADVAPRSLASSSEARKHLSVFAGTAMPAFLSSGQQRAILGALEQDPEPLIRSLWDSVGETVNDPVPLGNPDPRIYETGDPKFLVFDLPEPIAEGEPVLMAVQLRPTILVFSLRQQGPNVEDTMLLEERTDGVRSLSGGIDPTDREEFVEELATLARGDGTFKQGSYGTADYRPHHYMFAHKFLPAVFYKDPRGFVEKLEKKPEDYMKKAWIGVGASMEPEQRL